MATRRWQIFYGHHIPHNVVWFLCLYQVVYQVVTTAKGTPDNGYVIQTTKSNWWDASREGCEEFGGNLYIPPSLESHQDLAAILDPGQTYWIGAMEYSTWTWTYDESPLYEHTGYERFPSSGKPTEIEGNTAFHCHLNCGKRYTRIGLSGKACYCLVDEGYQTNVGKTVTEVRCPGNYDEWCGDDRGVSVYEIVDIDITLASQGQCVYAKKNPNVHHYYSSFHNDNNCSTMRSLAFTGNAPSPGRCAGTTCVEHGLRSWDSSEARRRLLKVSGANLDDLTDAMTYNYYQHNYYTYWIGLRRLYRRVWINGSHVKMDNDIHTDRFCLSINKSKQNATTLLWSLCTHSLKAVCQVGTQSTSFSTSTTTSHPSASTSSPPLPTEAGTTLEATSSSSAHATSTFSNATSDYQGLNTGTLIGISIACVVILAMTMAAIVIMKRHRLLFFEANPTTDTTDNVGYDNRAYATMFEDDHIYDTITEHQGRHGQSHLPVATVKPILHIYVNDPQLDKDEGYNVLSQCSSVVPSSVKPYDHVIVGGDGTVIGADYDRVTITNDPPKFNSNVCLDDNGDENEYISLKDDLVPVDDRKANPEEFDRADDRNHTIPDAGTKFDQHQNRRVAEPVYQNISQIGQSVNDDDEIRTGNVNGNVMTSHDGCYCNIGPASETDIAKNKEDGRHPIHQSPAATDA
ncbi:uncharacterized protein LOC124144598 [Haliotis rufescens]|uniref:uncharacterized protein LOC124144598 n=1 Tax=Haliotis rufescens TaxID=6454 RepID=UPI001EB05965|nr:uncharacterized protein LOC124144598 [Haliotis rufescens]